MSEYRAKEYVKNKAIQSRREQAALNDLEDRIRVVLEAVNYNPQGNDWLRFTDAQEEYIAESRLNERIATNMARNCLAFMMSENQFDLFAFGI